MPGIYRFTKMRNTLNAAWVTLSPPVRVTNRAPVSLTSVAPSRIVAGTSVQVTLRGEHLCALDLSTTYTGVSISNVSFDPAEGAGTRATATIEVAATALSGTATVEVSAGEGTTSFELTIVHDFSEVVFADCLFKNGSKGAEAVFSDFQFSIHTLTSRRNARSR